MFIMEMFSTIAENINNFSSQLLYLSSDHHIVNLYLKNGETLKSYGKLDDFVTQLSADFFVRCHQSYIVNQLKSFDEARQLIAEYIDFYNNERIQTKTHLTPLEKRRQAA